MVEGSLNAQGTAEKPIVFRSAAASPGNDDWDSITCAGFVSLKYCVIKNASVGVEAKLGTNTASVIQNACFVKCAAGIKTFLIPLTLQHITFDGCSKGYYANSADGSLSYCDFANSPEYAVYITVPTLTKTYDARLALLPPPTLVEGITTTTYISRSNFRSSNYRTLWQSSGSTVYLTYCYLASTTYWGYGTSYSDYAVSSPVPGAGCGFDYAAY
jgi:hypothetical protein